MNHQTTATAERHHLSSPDAERVAEQPLPDVFKRFGRDVAELLSGEVALARLELADEAPKVGAAVALFVVALVLGLGAFLAMTATLIAALALVLPVWGAALVVTAAYAIGAAIAALSGKANISRFTNPIPRVVRNLRIDVETVAAGFGRGR